MNVTSLEKKIKQNAYSEFHEELRTLRNKILKEYGQELLALLDPLVCRQSALTLVSQQKWNDFQHNDINRAIDKRAAKKMDKLLAIAEETDLVTVRGVIVPELDETFTN